MIPSQLKGCCVQFLGEVTLPVDALVAAVEAGKAIQLSAEESVDLLAKRWYDVVLVQAHPARLFTLNWMRGFKTAHQTFFTFFVAIQPHLEAAKLDPGLQVVRDAVLEACQDPGDVSVTWKVVPEGLRVSVVLPRETPPLF